MADTGARAARPLVFVAVDTETRGMSAIRHGINAIGACVAAADGTVIAKHFWALKPLPGQAYDPRCLKEFWDKPEMCEIRARIDNDAVDAGVAIAQFYKMLADLCVHNRVVLMCDAPYFDVPMLSYYLDVLGYPPLCYMPENGYVREPTAQVVFERSHGHAEKAQRPRFWPVTDMLAYASGAAGACIACTGKKFSKADLERAIAFDAGAVVHDHNPANDAEYIMRQFFAACKHACTNPEKLHA